MKLYEVGLKKFRDGETCCINIIKAKDENEARNKEKQEQIKMRSSYNITYIKEV